MCNLLLHTLTGHESCKAMALFKKKDATKKPKQKIFVTHDVKVYFKFE